VSLRDRIKAALGHALFEHGLNHDKLTDVVMTAIASDSADRAIGGYWSVTGKSPSQRVWVDRQ
jgi:hypothetical protein